MRRRRARGTAQARGVVRAGRAVSGPGNLTRAMGIILDQNRCDLTRRPPPNRRSRTAAAQTSRWSRRIGITVGVEPEWRCYAVGSDAVSGLRRPHACARSGDELAALNPQRVSASLTPARLAP